MRLSVFLLVYFAVAIQIGQSQDIVRIGLVDFSQAQTLKIRSISGGYQWLDATGQILDTLTESTQISIQNNHWKGNNLPLEQHLILQPIVPGSVLSIQSTHTGYRQVKGILHLFADSESKCILETPLEAYLPGVLVAEAGKGHCPEFYEAQAIVSRTYTVQSMGRHRLEGFDLCNSVHCQVFQGVSTVNDTILSAVMSTRDLVLIDAYNRPITAAFHSNCGGHTQGSEAVWQHALPYLKGVQDSFCLTYPHSHWEQLIDAEAWQNWLRSKSGDSLLSGQWLPTERESFLMNQEDAIRTSQAREAFGFRSGFFITLNEGDSIRVIGRGFGHGVGMCQEGAMGRAKANHDAWDILSHYYHKVSLTPWQNAQFQ